jgi:hypothetical protein
VELDSVNVAPGGTLCAYESETSATDASDEETVAVDDTGTVFTPDDPHAATTQARKNGLPTRAEALSRKPTNAAFDTIQLLRSALSCRQNADNT